MNIAQKIRDVWSLSPGFCVLVPVESITFGMTVSEKLPYGIISSMETWPYSVTNRGPCGRRWEAVLELHLPSMAAADTIQEEAEDLFIPENQCSLLSAKMECLEVNHWKVLLEISAWEQKPFSGLN